MESAIAVTVPVQMQRLIEDDHLGSIWVTEESNSLYTGFCDQGIWYRCRSCELQRRMYNVRRTDLDIHLIIAVKVSSIENSNSGMVVPIRQLQVISPDTISRIQKIWVGNTCELDSAMFTMPYDTSCLYLWD